MRDTHFHLKSVSHIEKVTEFILKNYILLRYMRTWGLVENAMRDRETAESTLEKILRYYHYVELWGLLRTRWIIFKGIVE